MIDEKAIENIREYGCTGGTGEKRKQLLVDDMGFPINKKAEYAIIAGCFQPEGMPHVLRAFKKVLDYLKVDYTLLDKEYCCGWLAFGQMAVITKNEVDIARFKELSPDFLAENFRQAKELGARSIVLFCSACEPNYTNYKNLTDLEVITYPQLIDRFFKIGKLHKKIDYYEGCYRFRRRITDVPVDTSAAINIMEKIEGLEVNVLDGKLCCNIPPHMDQLVDSIKSNTVVNICTGCYYALKAKLGGNPNIEVKMLPELVWEAIAGE
ncbi:MAG: heterodisulfide reductase-related iron-sulfur binding cluster [Dehalococcoidia bacterium]